MERRQNAVDWLIEQLKNNPLPITHNELEEGDWKNILETAKERYNKEITGLSESWAISREQTRQVAHRIGFGQGVMLGVENSEEYYERADKSPFHIEEEFQQDFISELYEEHRK